jgi:hypothetical protein
MSLKSQVIQAKILMYRSLYPTDITVIIIILFYYLKECCYLNINFIYMKIITSKFAPPPHYYVYGIANYGSWLASSLKICIPGFVDILLTGSEF